jgi:hypothetical protein
MKTTVAKFDPRSRQVSVEFVPLDASLIRPTARTYGKKDDASAGKPAAAQPAMATV